MKRICVIAVLLLSAVWWSGDLVVGQPEDAPRIGVTLRPYYSWVSNIVGDRAEVVAVLPEGASPHDYQPRVEDIKRIETLDAIVINGIGHDDFVFKMVERSGKADVPLINPNQGLALIPLRKGGAHSHEEKASGEVGEEPSHEYTANSHTYLSISSAITQVRAIARELGRLFPAHADAFNANGRAYTKRLRKLKSAAMSAFPEDFVPPRVATIHDGYAYLFQELTFEVVAVIEPAHGIQPSAQELAKTIDAIEKAKVEVVFSEIGYPDSVVETIRSETGVKVQTLDHVATGGWTAERFEEAMRLNFNVLTKLYGGKK